jgi:CHAT domain-containing protein
LIVVADGILHYVPFAALPKPLSTPASRYKPLIVDHEIVMLPSASVLAELRRDLQGRTKPTKALAVFADPVFATDDPRLRPSANQPGLPESNDRNSDLERSMTDLGLAGSRFPRLPFSRREAEGIIATAPAGKTAKALDFDASRARATTEDFGQYRIIHFATHGLLNSRRPELSGIVLSLVDSNGKSQDGFLRLHEVYNLKLPVDLVVLSACQTGLGKEIRGEGIVGLTRGFMYAGALRVVASLWKVDDAATADLMKRFYRGMLGKGLRPAAALREAQVEMWNQERWRSPYYWAAFVLQGEWK